MGIPIREIFGFFTARAAEVFLKLFGTNVSCSQWLLATDKNVCFLNRFSLKKTLS